ncbi:RNA 2',3'-cyclic phosphodiesterase [Gracilimonas sp. Q87]|uniref:RNA 2',3'-cyclic phosphodiesterase n=1 Tax=Gracilimonas sp. Q87 TaxID=3384766 RepID=UPI003983FC10
MNQELYFIALIPPDSLREQIQQIKLEVAEKFQSSHSLNAPPHITLISPFRVSDEHTSRLHSILEVYAQGHRPFKIQLKDFATFPPRVIFIDVKISEALQQFQQNLEKMIRAEDAFGYNYQKRPYHPHITLAFKDLSKENFYKAWDEFKDRNMAKTFLADHIYLLKHNGELWEIFRTYPLNKL